jgi:predicted 3-demethylubiquinone-9 3-methyltransferase (glyoxalase superfamily)
MKTTTFLTFVGDQCGKAKEAIDFYTSIFPYSKIISIKNYAKGEPGGTPELIKYGLFTINGTNYMVSESNYTHAWSFTPAVSLFISDNSEDVILTLFEKLSSNDGQVMVPLANYHGDGDYGFGKKFGWCQDKYGISWQFVLTE